MSCNNDHINTGVSDILSKISSKEEFPKLRPEFRESHYIKRIQKQKSPQRSHLDPTNSELVDIIIGTNVTVQIIQQENPFKWDGSYLGRICGKNILEQVVFSGIKYWKIEILGHRKICIIRSITNETACICDELKKYFSLPKLGTHTVLYRSKRYLLIEARTDSNNRIIEEITIDKVDPNSNIEFVQRVRETFVFREILGLIMSRDKSIVVRWSEKSYIPPYPVSFYESQMRPHDNNVVISNVVEHKWFDDTSIDDVIRSMLKIENNDDVIERIAYVRNNIENTIVRIDRDMIWMVQPIIDKLTRRLLKNESEISATPDWE